MLNFKQFLMNAASFMSADMGMDPLGKVNIPEPIVNIPTISTANPVKIFSVLRKGKAYEIQAENNVSWYMPANHYIYLKNLGKEPRIDQKVHLEFYKDGSVKGYSIVRDN